MKFFPQTISVWKALFWIMPAIYFSSWVMLSSLLRLSDPLAAGVSIFFFINMIIFTLIFRSQKLMIGNDDPKINKVVLRKLLYGVIIWVLIIMLGLLMGPLGLIICLYVAMWASSLIFLLSGRCEILGITGGGIQTKSILWNDSSYQNVHEPVSHGVNPATGLPMVNSSYDIDGNSYGFKNN